MNKKHKSAIRYKKIKHSNPVKSISGILKINYGNSDLIEEEQGYAFIKKHF